MELRVPVTSSNPAFDKDYDKDYSEIPADPDYLTTTRDEAGYEMPFQYDLPKYNQNTSHDRYVRQPMVASSGHSNQQFQPTTADSGHSNQQFQPTTAGSGHHPKQSDLSISGSSQPVKQNIVRTEQKSYRKWRCITIVLVVLCVLLIVGILLAYFLPERSGTNSRNQQSYSDPVPASNPAFDMDYDKEYSEIPADPDYLTLLDDNGYETPVKYNSPKNNQKVNHERYGPQPTLAGSGHNNQQFQPTVADSGNNNQQFQPTTAGSGHHPKESDLSTSGNSQPVKPNIEVGTGQKSYRKWRCIAIVLVVVCVLLIVGILLAYFLPKKFGPNTRNQQDYTGGCDGEWLRTDSMRSEGGLAIVSDSAATCQRICEDMFECLAVDKHTREDLCWLHTQPDYSTERKPDGKFTQYVLQERCNRYQGSICMVMSPCENGATCEASSKGQYSCICPRHCSGVHCQTCGCPIDFLTGEVSNLRMKIGTVEKTVPVYVETGPVGDIWIVLMRREDGSEDFANRTWADYKEGFGDLSGEFWLGNDIIHALTNNGSEYILRIDMRAWTGECRYAEYSSFRIGAESEKYQLHVKGYSGTSEDSLTAGFRDDYTNHDNNFFSTNDVDNDENDELNCALDNTGGWWYTDCFYSKLTGEYGQEVGKEDGISWEAWLGLYNYLQYADMKIQVRL